MSTTTAGSTGQAGPHPLPLHRGDRRRGPRGHHRPRLPGLRRRAEVDRYDVRRADQDDDPAGHLLHARARRRLGAQRRQRRQGRRPRAGLLPDDVHRRARHRACSSATSSTPARACTSPTTSPGSARSRPRRAHGSTTDFIIGIVPDSLLSSLTSGEVLQTLLVALLVGFALQAMGRAGRADPARHRPPPAPGLPGPRDDHVGRPGRRLRRDRGRGRRDRRGRDQEPADDHDRLLHHLLPVRLRHPRHDPQAGDRA